MHRGGRKINQLPQVIKIAPQLSRPSAGGERKMGILSACGREREQDKRGNFLNVSLFPPSQLSRSSFSFCRCNGDEIGVCYSWKIYFCNPEWGDGGGHYVESRQSWGERGERGEMYQELLPRGINLKGSLSFRLTRP